MRRYSIGLLSLLAALAIAFSPTATPDAVADCPAGTHWDSVTQTCR